MSCFKEYLGIAAQDLMGDDPVDLEVFVPELLPMLEGDVDETLVENEDKREIELKNLAVDGIATTNITVSNTFKCKYLGIRTNMSMPNIHLGEQIRVFQFKDTSQFYWAPMGRDDSIRRTEHLKIKVANKPKTEGELDDDHVYFFEMDTREGQRKIHIHTSNGTEEEVTYDLLIDTDKSEVSLLDSNGNGIHLKSKEYWMKAFNSEEEHGCFWEIDKDNIHMHAVKEYKVTCDTYVRESTTSDTITTKKTTRESTDTIDTHTKANALVADDTDETTTGAQKVTAQTQDNQIPKTLYSGVVGIGGALLIGGSLAAGTSPGTDVSAIPTSPANEVAEDMTFKKKINGEDDIVTTGEVTAKSDSTDIDLSTHTHTGDGASPTPGPTSSPITGT